MQKGLDMCCIDLKIYTINLKDFKRNYTKSELHWKCMFTSIRFPCVLNVALCFCVEVEGDVLQKERDSLSSLKHDAKLLFSLKISSSLF